jgi:hypothetical protein
MDLIMSSKTVVVRLKEVGENFSDSVRGLYIAANVVQSRKKCSMID